MSTKLHGITSQITVTPMLSDNQNIKFYVSKLAKTKNSDVIHTQYLMEALVHYPLGISFGTWELLNM